MTIHIPDLKLYLKDADYQIGVQYQDGHTAGLHSDSYAAAKQFIEMHLAADDARKIIADVGSYGKTRHATLQRTKKGGWEVNHETEVGNEENDDDEAE